MSGRERCDLCGREAHDVALGLVIWTDQARRAHDLPWSETVHRCPDKQACRGRLESAGGTWPVQDAITRPTIRPPQSREELPV